MSILRREIIHIFNDVHAILRKSRAPVPAHESRFFRKGGRTSSNPGVSDYLVCRDWRPTDAGPFFNVDERLKRLSKLGDQEAFSAVVDFETFRADLGIPAALKARDLFDPVMLF